MNVVVTPKSIIDDVKAALDERGDTLGTVTARKDGTVLWNRPRSRVAYIPSIILGGIAIGLLATAGLAEMGKLDRHTERLEQLLTLERKQAAKAQDLRRTYERTVGIAKAIQSARAQSGSRLSVLEEIARRMDDSIWLIALSMEGGSLKLSGISSGAVSPIPVLEGSPKLTNVEATSATTADARLGGDRFEIRADIVGSVLPTETPQ